MIIDIQASLFLIVQELRAPMNGCILFIAEEKMVFLRGSSFRYQMTSPVLLER